MEAGDNARNILTINAGSSSIKLGLFSLDNDIPKRLLESAVEDIGQPVARFIVKSADAAENSPQSVVAGDHAAAAEILVDWLKQQTSVTVSAVGHRIVHGGPKYYEACVIDDEVVKNLRELTLFDPEHLPVEIQLIETFQRLFPEVTQIACFDTAFHHDLPLPARLLPIPRRYEGQGIRRYGFHGLSYAYVLRELERLAGPEAANGRVIMAHLGSGVSLAAVHHGKSIDTTMGLTPTGGVPMSTRSGDLDPGLITYLVRSEGLDAAQLDDLVNFQSGLLGISGTTADMEALLQQEDSDSRAKDAVDLFCYQIKKSIGGLAAALGGLNTLVFTGGMGEQAPKIRARICQGLEFLGLTIEESRNATNEGVISSDESTVTVRVIPTDEAATIAQNVQDIIAKKGTAT